MAECWACLRSLVEQGSQPCGVDSLACGHPIHSVCLEELKDITGFAGCPACEDSRSRTGHTAAGYCRAAAVEYLRALRSTSAGTPARHVVTQRCLGNLQKALAFDENHGNSLTLLGILHQSGLGVPMDEIKAYHYFLEAHQHHEPLGTLYLARCYKRGTGCNPDLDKARELFAEADLRGKLMATLELALMCRAGSGGATDTDRSVELLEKADRGGDALAAYELGMAYLYERMNLPKDGEKARLYMKAACERGYVPAIVELAEIYMQGIGGPQDIKKARELTMAVDFPKPHHPAEVVDSRALTCGWLSGSLQELYAADVEKLDPNEWWQLRMPAPEEEDPNAMLKAMGLYPEPVKITTSGPFAPRSAVEPAPGSEPGGLWRATMAFGGVEYGEPVLVSPEQASRATGKRVVVETEAQGGISIIAEYVLPHEYDAFMRKQPQLDETSSISSCAPFGGISSRLRKWIGGSSRPSPARRPSLKN